MEKNYISVLTVTEDRDISLNVENISVTDSDRRDVWNLGVKDDIIALVKSMDEAGNYCNVLEFAGDCLDIWTSRIPFNERLQKATGMNMDELYKTTADLEDKISAAENNKKVNIECNFNNSKVTKFMENEILKYFEDTKNHDFDYGYDFERKVYEAGPKGIGRLVASSI